MKLRSLGLVSAAALSLLAAACGNSSNAGQASAGAVVVVGELRQGSALGGLAEQFQMPGVQFARAKAGSLTVGLNSSANASDLLRVSDKMRALPQVAHVTEHLQSCSTAVSGRRVRAAPRCPPSG